MTDIPPGGHDGSPPVDEGQDLAPYVPAERRRSRGRVAAFVGGVLAAAAAGVFAVTMLSAGSGSATPEAAVERLFDAVGSEDVIGVLEALTPGERSAVRPGLETVAEELRRLGIAPEDFDLAAVGGVDLEFDDLALEGEDLGPGVAAVRITGGTVTTSTRPDELPIGPTLSKLLDEFDAQPDFEPTTTTEDLTVDAPVIVAVDRGDGWHVSLSYSVAEGIRREAGEPVPAFGQGVEAEGAESPEAAVRQAVEAAAAFDVRRVIALISPSEAGALHDYAPVFLDDAEAAVEEMRAEVPFDVSVTRLDLTSETEGDVARVLLNGFEASGTLPDLGRFSMSFDGDCSTMEIAGEVEEACASDFEEAGGPPMNTEMVVTTVRDDGRWYVSPTRTLFGALVSSLRLLDREDLENPEAFLGGLFGAGLGLGFPGDDPFGAIPGESSSPFDIRPGADLDGPSSREEMAAEECFAMYEDLPSAAGPEDYERIEREVEDCLERIWEE
jgi:hypothetical protein